MFNLPRNPICQRTPGVEGPGSIQPNYEQTPTEAESPVGRHRGREIKSTDATSYLAEQERLVTDADNPSPIKAEATPVSAHHTAGLKKNKPDQSDSTLLQERVDLLEKAEKLLGTINEQKVVGISLEVLEKARANGPEQVLAMLNSMKFPSGLNVKITLKSQPDKPLSLIPPGAELANQKQLGRLMDKTIETLKRHDKHYANTEARVSEAETIRQSLVTNDNKAAGRDTGGQGEGAQAFDKLRNRRCAITVHHRTPVEKSYVEARHHDTSTQPSAPVYPVPLPLVNSSQTIVSPQPAEEEPVLPQGAQQATDTIGDTTTENSSQPEMLQPEIVQPPAQPTESSPIPATEQSATSQPLQTERKDDPYSALLREIENRQWKLKPINSNNPVEENNPQTSGRDIPDHDTADTPEDSRSTNNSRLMEQLSQKLADIKPKTPEDVDEMDRNVARKWAQTAERVKNDSLPFADELIKKVATRSRPSLEQIEADIAKHKQLNIHEDTEKPVSEKPQSSTNSQEPGYDNPNTPESPDVSMEEMAEPYKPVLSPGGYQPAETTVSFPPFPASDKLPATDDNAVPKDETENMASSQNTFSSATFKAELEKAVARMMRRSPDTIDTDDITDLKGLSDQLPDDLSTASADEPEYSTIATPPGTQPTDDTAPLTAPSPPAPPPISEELLRSARTMKTPAPTSTAQAITPEKTTGKPSNQGFFSDDSFKTELAKAVESRSNKRQADSMDIDQQIAEAKVAEAKKEKESNSMLGMLKKRMDSINWANRPDQDRPDDEENDEFRQ